MPHVQSLRYTEKPRPGAGDGANGAASRTTLAAMIDKINETREEHIMSVETPIEFLHEHKRGIVNQREVNQDTKSFAEASSTSCGRTPT